MSGKIFNIGLSRTGTTTLHHMFVTIGLKSAHFLGLDLDRVWKKIDAVDCAGDTPIPLIYRECDRRYPGSKFILTTRDKDSWLESMEWLFTHGKVIWNFGDSMDRYCELFYGTSKFDPQILGAFWDEYHEQIDEYFHVPGRLLKVDVRDLDHQALGKFLGLTVTPMDVGVHNVRQKAPPTARVRYRINRMLGRIK